MVWPLWPKVEALKPVPAFSQGLSRRSWLIFATAAALWFQGTPARAVTRTWADVGTDFATAANWGGTAPANNITGDIGSFNSVLNFQPVLAANRAINGLAFTTLATGTVTLSGAGTLTTGTGGINNTSTSGLKSVSTSLILGAAQSFTNNGSLTISGPVANGGFLLTLTGTGAAGTLSGDISGTGGLTKTGTGTWIVSGNNSYSGATNVSAGVLNVQSNTALGSTAGGTTVASGAALQLQNGLTITGEALSLNGTGIGATGALRNVSGSNTWTGAVTLAGITTLQSDAGLLTLSGGVSGTNRNLTVGGAGDTTLSGALATGTGTVTKTGNGTLILSGTNTNTGATTINGGTLKLGSSASLANSAVTVSATGAGTTVLLDINGFNATIASLTFGGSTATSTANVATGAGTLTLGGNVTFTATNNPFGSTHSGNLNLGAATRTFTIGDSTSAPADLTVSANISNSSGTAGLTKAGLGTLVLSGNNTFNGATTVSAGVLNVRSNTALGSSGSGTSVTALAALQLQGGITISGEPLTLNGTGIATEGALRNISGNNTWTGAVTLGSNSTLQSDSGLLTLSGGITGATRTLTVGGAGDTTLSGAVGTTTGGFIKNGTGSLTLSGAAANTNTGTTVINDGTLNLNKTAGVNALGAGAINVGDNVGAANSANLVLLASNQMAASTAAITLNSDGRLSLGTSSQSINTIAGTGQIDLGSSGILTVGANNGSSTFGGNVTGSGELIKVGSGTFTFNSTLNYTGTLTIASGTVALNGFNLTAGTLHITGNSAASFLNVNTLIIDTGVLLTINNWVNAVDYFTVQNDPGGSQGNVPLNQITFTGGSYTNNDTKWLSYDKQITPAPEPATYGAILAGGSTLLLAWRRRRRALAG